jgi:hypothetical protein
MMRNELLSLPSGGYSCIPEHKSPLWITEQRVCSRYTPCGSAFQGQLSASAAPQGKMPCQTVTRNRTETFVVLSAFFPAAVEAGLRMGIGKDGEDMILLLRETIRSTAKVTGRQCTTPGRSIPRNIVRNPSCQRQASGRDFFETAMLIWAMIAGSAEWSNSEQPGSVRDYRQVMGDSQKDAASVDFDRQFKLEFRNSIVTKVIPLRRLRAICRLNKPRFFPAAFCVHRWPRTFLSNHPRNNGQL